MKIIHYTELFEKDKLTTIYERNRWLLAIELSQVKNGLNIFLLTISSWKTGVNFLNAFAMDVFGFGTTDTYIKTSF